MEEKSTADEGRRKEVELGLLEKVFLCLGSASTDDQLQAALLKFLVPTILKSSSEFKSVQDKVVEILTHVSRRLRSRPDVLLPMAPLLEQFTSPDSAPPVVNFSLVYIKMGFQRLSASAQVNLLPDLLNSLSGRTSQHQCDSILKLFSSCVEHLPIPKDQKSRETMLGLDKKSEVRKNMVAFMQDYLLLPYGPIQVTGRGLAPAGLSWSLLERLTGGDQLYKHEKLEKVKRSMVRLLTCELFTSQEVLVSLLVAACDARTSVVDLADTPLKRVLADVDLESSQIVSKLLTLYQGTSTVLGKRPNQKASSPSPKESRSPASLRLKLRLLPILTKSTLAANSFPSTVQVVFDSLFGDSSNSRLRLYSLHFIQHICAKATIQKLKVMGPILLTGLNKVIDEPTEESNLQILSYVIIGQLAKRIPSLFVKDTKQLSKMFSNLKKETRNQDLSLAIQECLSMMAAAYREVDGQSALIIEGLVLENIYSDVVRARQAAVNYARLVFPFSHMPSRFACMLACGDSQGEIREEGGHGLTPPSPDSILGGVDPSTCEPPDFCDMTMYLHTRDPFVIENLGTRLSPKPARQVTRVLESGQVYSTTTGKLPFPPPVLSEALKFLSLCLSHSAGVTSHQTLEGTSLPVIASYIARVLETNTDCLLQYLDLTKYGLSPAADGVLSGVALHSLLVLMAADSSHLIATILFPDKPLIKKFSYSTISEVREPAARLYGLLARRLEMPLFLGEAANILKDCSHSNFSIQRGTIVTMGHVGAAMMEKLEESGYGEDDRQSMISLLRSALCKLVDLMKNYKFVHLSISACIALGNIFRSGILPLPVRKDGWSKTDTEKGNTGPACKPGSKTTEEVEPMLDSGSTEEQPVQGDMELMDIEVAGDSQLESHGKKKATSEVEMVGKSSEGSGKLEKIVSKAELVQSIVSLSKSSPLDKVKENAASSLGYLCVGDQAFPLREAVLEGLYGLREEKAIELQFTVGEALACSLAGRHCTAAHDPWNPQPQEDKSCSGDEVTSASVMEEGLRKLLSRFASGTSPIVRQSCCIWLLSILKHAAKHPGIQPHLKSIQLVFMDMLTESSEVTQEVAARGMGLVYDMSPAEGKKELVQGLFSTLMEGRKSSAKVTEDTKLFDDGQLGKTKQGGKLSTYKELCSLASDLNQPDLVYQFMALANHNALWNSKKGAAFGFSKIANQAQDQLAPFLPGIVPRLYRYKYDPNPGVQSAMTSIWSAVIPDHKAVMDKYLQEILQDLKTNLASPLWRNRQASCIALSDLLSSRQVVEVAKHIPELWPLVLRVMDDIKESVRKAAEVACKSLHKVTVHACDPSVPEKTGEVLMKGVLPVFLEGLVSPSKEIKSVCINSILKISKTAGTLLKPHVSELVPTLLESLSSSMEMQGFNYLSLLMSSEAGAQEVIDTVRVSASKTSPVMEIIQISMVQVGVEELPSLVPRLLEIMKKGVGVATKVMAAQLIITLVSQSREDLTPYASKLMAELVNGLSDHNTTVRKACAKSIGYLVKVAKGKTISKTISKLKSKYLKREVTESSVAYVTHAMAMYSPDVATNFSSDLLPLIFLGMHTKPGPDDDSEAFETVVSKWKEAWEELVPNAVAGIRVHLAEIIEIVTPSLQSQSWSMKAQAAAAIATITEKMGKILGPPHLTVLVCSLVDGLQGRIWDGKSVLLKSLTTLCKSCKEALLHPEPQSQTATFSETDTRQPTPVQIAEVMLSQCKKKPVGDYKAVAIESAGDIIESLEVDVFSKLLAILPVTNPVKEKEEDVEGDDHWTSASAKLELQVKSFHTLGQAWPTNKQTQGLHYSELVKLLCSSLPRNHWKAQVSILFAISSVYDKLTYAPNDEDIRLVETSLIPSICQCLGDLKYHAVRSGALQSLENITKYFAGVLDREWTEDTIQVMSSALKNVVDWRLKDRAEALSKSITKQ